MRSVAGRNPLHKKYFAFFISLLFVFDAAANQTLIDRELTVLRGDFKEVHYLIPVNGPPAKIQGSFTCRGGMNDDVNFIVLTKDQYVRWYSSYPHKPLFRVDKKKEGRFEINAVPGETYYFVFDNFFSSVSNKQVKLQVKLLLRK